MSDSESSESDNFYDAEDNLAPNDAGSRRRSKSRSFRDPDPVSPIVQEAVKPKELPIPLRKELVSPVVESQIEILTGDQLSSRDQRWSRLEKLRRREEQERGLEVEDDQAEPDSAESSVEGIYVSGVRAHHPFKVVEPDSRSIQSDSKSVARTSSQGEGAESRLRLSVEESVFQVCSASKPTKDQESPSHLDQIFGVNKPADLFVEKDEPEPLRVELEGEEEEVVLKPDLVPDIVSSTTPLSPPTALSSAPDALPMAPPRRKKKSDIVSTSRKTGEGPVITVTPIIPPPLPSPTTTVNSITRDLEESLLFSTPPDHERDRGSAVDHRDKIAKGNVETISEELGRSGTFSQDPAGALGFSDDRIVVKSKSPVEDRKDSVRSRSYKAGGSGGQRSEGQQSGSSGGYHSGGSGGHHSAGGGGRPTSGRGSGGSDRRSMAGSEGSDGGIIKQLGMYVRTKSDSGKKLTDQEILQQIKVKNLDTGTEMDLATAEENLHPSINPLSLHIMRLTSEYTGTFSTPSIAEGTSFDSDTESVLSSVSDFTIGEGKKRTTLKGLFGEVKKSATKAARLVSAEVTKRQRTKEEKAEEKLGRLATDIQTTDGVQVSCKDADLAAATNFKRIQAHKSGPWDFENIQFGQDLSGHHCGPIWCMKFSLCGRLLATAGQDCILRIWVLRDKHGHFSDMRRRYQVEHEGLSEDLVNQDEITEGYLNSPDSRGHIFMDRPFVTYTGHTSDLLDISWSSNFFILTSSMDKTVRLWHISRQECLCVFQHIDFVTAIGFHPRNDKFFISGSLDGKIRLWNIPDKKVALWNEVDGPTKLITAANFCQNGKFAVVGTYDGRCIFYSTDQLKYHTTIHVRSARGKNSRGRKVTGIEPMPGEDKILVTSTDSRIRLYDLRDLSLICKYRGYTNLSSQIRACFSPDGRYICAGSENHCVFLWSSVHIPPSLTVRKDRNNYYEAIKAHNAAVTCTLFAPVPELVFEAVERGREAAGKPRETKDAAGDPLGESEKMTGYVVISGDYDGDIKVFIKEGKKQTSLPRH